MLELGLELLVLFLKLVDDIVFDLDLFNGLVVSSMSLGSVNTILFLLFLKKINDLVKLGCFDLIASHLILELFLLVQGVVDLLFLLELLLFLGLNLFAVAVTFSSHFLKFLLSVVDDLLLLSESVFGNIVEVLEAVFSVLETLSFGDGLVLFLTNDFLFFELFLDDLG